MSEVATMSSSTADVLLGGGDRGCELGDLAGLVRRTLAVLDAEPNVGLRISGVGTALATPFTPPVAPDLQWDMPALQWEVADFSVPPA